MHKIDQETHALVRTSMPLAEDTVMMCQPVPMHLRLEASSSTVRVVNIDDELDEDNNYVQEEPDVWAHANLEVRRYIVLRPLTKDCAELEKDFTFEELHPENVTVRHATPTMKVLLKHLLPGAHWSEEKKEEQHNPQTLAWIAIKRYDVVLITESPRADDITLLDADAKISTLCPGWLLPPTNPATPIEVDSGDYSVRGLNWMPAGQDKPSNALGSANMWCSATVVARARREDDPPAPQEERSEEPAADAAADKAVTTSGVSRSPVVGKTSDGRVLTFSNARDLLLAGANKLAGENYYIGHHKVSGGWKFAVEPKNGRQFKVLETRKHFLDHVKLVFDRNLLDELANGSLGNIVDSFVVTQTRKKRKAPAVLGAGSDMDSDEVVDDVVEIGNFTLAS